MRRWVMIAVVSGALAVRATGGGLDDAESLEQEDPAAALKLAEEALAKNANDDRAYMVRARAHELLRDFRAAAADYERVIALVPTATHLYVNVGQAEFRAGRIERSLAAFDKAVAASPQYEPYLWQRGLALYYAGEYERGARQFELHRTVNAEDVENAVWHFMCVARVSGVDAARKQLIPIKQDDRVPMMQVHALFAGRATVGEVLYAAESADGRPAARKRQMMYANLYAGLYEEAQGHAEAAREYVTRAATQYAGDDYMSDVARVHAARLAAAAATRPTTGVAK